MFDWQAFLDNNAIEYTDRGRNVSKGNLALHCPFCGEADESMHMNVSLEGHGWACWREADHRGGKPARLVQALLQCSWQQAKEITDDKQRFVPQQEGLSAAIGRMLKRDDYEEVEQLEMPRELRRLSEGDSDITRDLIVNYLKGRGYSHADVITLAKRFDIHYSHSGPWSKRVVWPLRNEHGALVNITGRHIGSRTPRYKTVSNGEGGTSISRCLFDAARLFKVKNANGLVVCEGPMDSTRMSWLGETFGLYATCVFTANVSDEQADMLLRLEGTFANRYILFDQGARIQALRAKQQLGSGWKRVELPPGVKDPGELSPAQLLSLCRLLCVVPQ